MRGKLKLGITIGDFNGIGPELIIRSLATPLVLNYCTPIVYANSYVLKHYSALLNIDLPEIHSVKKDGAIVEGKVNLRVCSNERIEIAPGEPSVASATFALASLNMAIGDVKTGAIDNILTAPLDKHTAKQAGLEFNGHTEYLAQQFESEAFMILLSDEMKVAMVTGHTSLESISSELTEDSIYQALLDFDHSLKHDFSIMQPKIAVLGLNPHAGDKGLMGNQESELIGPAIERAKNMGIMAVGPYPPDGFFGSKQASFYDGILGMYHDQVLIPFKQSAFGEGVNFTAGLPIIRTSPDHGTAYDLAGKGIADISSFVHAMYLINKIHRNRLENYDTSKPFLKFKDHRREKFSIGVPDLN